MLTAVTDGLTAVITPWHSSTVTVWDLSNKSATAAFQVGGRVSALAISADGRRVLTGTTDGEVTLWDAAGARLQRYAWACSGRSPSRSTGRECAAVGGTSGQIVVWDLDE